MNKFISLKLMIQFFFIFIVKNIINYKIILIFYTYNINIINYEIILNYISYYYISNA